MGQGMEVVAVQEDPLHSPPRCSPVQPSNPALAHIPGGWLPLRYPLSQPEPLRHFLNTPDGLKLHVLLLHRCPGCHHLSGR
jgi:hypothetical protein